MSKDYDVSYLSQELPTWDPYWKSQVDHVLARKLNQFVFRSHYYCLLEHLFNRIRPNLPRRITVLEAGAGSGILSIALFNKREEYIRNMTLLDKSPVGLCLAREFGETELGKELASRLRFVQGDLFHSPFPRDSFDVVFNEGVMEHFDGSSREAAFKAIARICRPGGHYICIVPNKLNVPLMLRNKVSQRAGRWQYGFQREFTILELFSQLRRSGFRICAIGGLDSIAPMRHLLKELRGEHFDAPNGTVHEISPFFKRLQRFTWNVELSSRLLGALLGREIGVLAQKLADD